MAIQDDIIAVFKLLPGGSATADAAAKKFEAFKALIRAEAKKGAEEAIPTIEDAIKPYILAAFGIGAVGVILGVRNSLALSQRPRALSGHATHTRRSTR